MHGPQHRLQQRFRDACPSQSPKSRHKSHGQQHGSSPNSNGSGSSHGSSNKNYVASWRDILTIGVFLLTILSNYFLLYSTNKVIWLKGDPALFNNVSPSTRRTTNNKRKQSNSAAAAAATNRSAPMVTPSFSKPAPKAGDPICRRACGYYNNKIFLSAEGRAGLNDRLFVFESMLNLAGYLCATLHVSRPKHQLSPLHNENVELDARMPWSEFATFSYLNDQYDDNDQQRALVDWVNHANIEEPPGRNLVTYAPQFKRWLRVFTDSSSKFLSHFQQVEEQSFGQKQDRAFVWEISTNFYDWSDILSDFLMKRKELRLNETMSKSEEEQKLARTWTLMQPYIRSADHDYSRKWYWGCEYAKMDPPQHLHDMQEKLVRLIYQQGPGAALASSASSSDAALAPLNLSQPSNTLVGHFHIRRGDAIHECNTSLQRIEQYLDCSLARALPTLPSPSTGPQVKHLVILFSSDERDAQYRRAVIDLVQKQQQRLDNKRRITVTCVDFDMLVYQAVQDEIDVGNFPSWRLNNFYLYRLISGLSYNSSVFKFRLEQRRSGFSCPTCTNLTEQLLLDRSSMIS